MANLRDLIYDRLNGDPNLQAICRGDECRCGHSIWVAFCEYSVMDWDWHCLWCNRPHPRAHHKQVSAPNNQMNDHGWRILMRRAGEGASRTENSGRTLEMLRNLSAEGAISVTQETDALMIYATRSVSFSIPRGDGKLKNWFSMAPGQKTRLMFDELNISLGPEIRGGPYSPFSGTYRGPHPNDDAAHDEPMSEAEGFTF